MVIVSIAANAVLALVLVSLWLLARKALKTERLKTAEAMHECQKALAFAEKEHRRAADQFKVIDDVLKERETWKRIYMQMSIQAGAAQDWLGRELARALGALNEYRTREGKPLASPDPGLEDLVRQYSENHPAKTIEAAEESLSLKPKSAAISPPDAPSAAD